MPKLIIKQNVLEYYGFFSEPLFSLFGESGAIVSGLYKTFLDYNISLGSFKLEGDPSEPASSGVSVLIPRFGNYRLKFDNIQVGLRSFTDDDLAGMLTVIQKGDVWLRELVPSVKYRSHAAVYTGHFGLDGTTSSEFLLKLPRRNTPVIGKDLGSGIVETWYDDVIDGKIRLTIDHSLQEIEGLYVSYIVTLERDTIDFINVAQRANSLLEQVIRDLGLEFD